MIGPIAEKSTSAAELSVVVPSVNGPADLVGCLEALEAQADARLEILVVDRIGESVRQIVRSRFPHVRLIGVPQGTTIPQMRAIAFAEARAESVAVIEDHVIVPGDWARRLLDAQTRTRAVVGGSVENAATERLVDWAAFLCEYSHCIPPLPAGPVEWLTGNNVVYPRAVLQRHRAVIEEGKWENHLHEALKRDGVSLVCVPEIAVGHKKHYTIREYLSQRYLYARSYAGARVAGQPMPKRVAYGIAAIALPPLLFYRTLTRVVSKGRHRAELVRSLPLLALFVTSWALGEVVGYWAGPGDSLGKVC
jgi:glycosyltransferase involved in cell wall biosynthesis